jgi:hypothetical protein
MNAKRKDLIRTLRGAQRQRLGGLCNNTTVHTGKSSSTMIKMREVPTLFAAREPQHLKYLRSLQIPRKIPIRSPCKSRRLISVVQGLSDIIPDRNSSKRLRIAPIVAAYCRLTES